MAHKSTLVEGILAVLADIYEVCAIRRWLTQLGSDYFGPVKIESKCEMSDFA